MTAVRDHPERPSLAQCHVLDRLALRMDWQTGSGFASVSQLAADAGCAERNVRNAITWARNHDLLTRTRRGHRRGDGTAIASEWCLTLPVNDTFSTGTGMPVETISTGTNGHLNRHGEPSQPARTAPPSRTSSSRTSSSARRRDRAESADAGADEPATPRCLVCGGYDHDTRVCLAKQACPRCRYPTGHAPGCNDEDPAPMSETIAALKQLKGWK
jgi:hypothetical protein